MQQRLHAGDAAQVVQEIALDVQKLEGLEVLDLKVLVRVKEGQVRLVQNQGLNLAESCNFRGAERAYFFWG